jgi:SAM-dependent methyltransferase
MVENFKKLYTGDYVRAQLIKFNNRHQNHWKNHIELAKRMISQFVPKSSTKMLDLGCSIGTFAIEFSLEGYKTIGLDFDEKAIAQAKILSNELGCNSKWIQEDATVFNLKEKVDFVICFDLLEHLTDKMIEATLFRVRENLNDKGKFIFHTFPTEFDHLFYKNPLTCIPLIPFKNLSNNKFEIIVKYYAKIYDFYCFLRYKKKYEEYIKGSVHPNPLSVNRLKEKLLNAGFDILFLETGLDEINPLKPGQGKLAKQFFTGHPIIQRSIWGCAQKK